MKFELIEEANSGEKARIYSPVILDEYEDITLYERFVRTNSWLYKTEVHNIDERLRIVGNETGLQEEFFETKAGKYGQNLCKLKDRPKAKLRLYFIFYSYAAIILGGGGFKGKSKRAHQEDKILDDENTLIGNISDTLQAAETRGHFGIDEDGKMWSTTNYIYDTENYASTKKKR